MSDPLGPLSRRLNKGTGPQRPKTTTDRKPHMTTTVTAESAVKDVVALAERIAERGCDPQPGQPTEHRSQEITELEHALITTRVRDLLAEILADIRRERFTSSKDRITVVSAMERISNLVGRLQADLHEHRDTWSTPQLDPYFLADLESIGEKCDNVITDYYVARSVQIIREGRGQGEPIVIMANEVGGCRSAATIGLETWTGETWGKPVPVIAMKAAGGCHASDEALSNAMALNEPIAVVLVTHIESNLNEIRLTEILDENERELGLNAHPRTSCVVHLVVTQDDD